MGAKAKLGRSRRDKEGALAELLVRARESGRRDGASLAVVRLLERVARRLLLRDAQDAARMVSEPNPVGAITRAARETWPRRWEEAFAPIVFEIMDAAPVSTDRGTATPPLDLSDPATAGYLRRHLVRLSGDVTRTTLDRVTGVIRQAHEEGAGVPETARRIGALGEEFGRSRAELIARTELLAASNGAALAKARGSGLVRTKRWLATPDDRVRPEHRALHGTVVGIGEAFPNGLTHPSEPRCRCTLEFGLDEKAIEGGGER